MNTPPQAQTESSAKRGQAGTQRDQLRAGAHLRLFSSVASFSLRNPLLNSSGDPHLTAAAKCHQRGPALIWVHPHYYTWDNVWLLMRLAHGIWRNPSTQTSYPSNVEMLDYIHTHTTLASDAGFINRNGRNQKIIRNYTGVGLSTAAPFWIHIFAMKITRNTDSISSN